MAKTETGMSLRPSEMTTGGALIDDADVTISAAKFVLYDFNGKADTKACAALTLKTEDGDEHVEYLSAADPKHFEPSSDGSRLLATGDKTGLNNNSKFAIFVVSLINAGFAESEISDDIGFLQGLRVHIKRQAAPKGWSSMQKRGEREPTVLEVTAILDEKPAKSAKGAAGKGAPAKAASKAAPKAAAGEDFDDELMQIVVKAATEAGGSLDKKALVPAVFRLAPAATKKAMVKRVFEDDFLNAGMEQGLWMYDAEAATVEVVG